MISARLSPEKGLIQFLHSLQFLNETEKNGLTIWITGSGPQRGELRRWVDAHDLDVHLLGHQTEAEMVEFYTQAEGFCLPSLLDPNPLSVIEALWAGLPLLLSSRVGNHPECLWDGRNGFLFDPLDPKSVANGVSRWLALRSEELTQFGENSLVMARNGFDPDQVIRKFLDEVLADLCTVDEEVVDSTHPPPRAVLT